MHDRIDSEHFSKIADVPVPILPHLRTISSDLKCPFEKIGGHLAGTDVVILSSSRAAASRDTLNTDAGPNRLAGPDGVLAT